MINICDYFEIKTTNWGCHPIFLERFMKVNELLEKETVKGLYAAVKFSKDTIDRILKYCGDKDIPNILNPEDFHSTLCYSRKLVPDFKPVDELFEEGKPKKFEIWESPPNAFKEEKTFCLVLKYSSSYMENRFKEIMDMGATYDYDEYKPHLTISYDVGEGFDVSKLVDIDAIAPLDIIGEYSEELDLDKNY